MQATLSLKNSNLKKVLLDCKAVRCYLLPQCNLIRPFMVQIPALCSTGYLNQSTRLRLLRYTTKKAEHSRNTRLSIIYPTITFCKYGRGGIRTHDLILKRDLLYQLSYTPPSNKQRQLIYRNIIKMQGKVFFPNKNPQHIKKNKEKKRIFQQISWIKISSITI